MTNSNTGFRTLLVIGENHSEIAKKYSLDTQVEPYIRYRFDDVEKLHTTHMKTLEMLIKSVQDTNRELAEKYRAMYEECREMDDFENYQQLTYGCKYDDNGDAWSTENPNAHYQYERCYDKRIRQDQRDWGNFSNPLILKDGTLAYSALVGEIDWPKNHMAKVDSYRAMWEICVEGREPLTEEERLIKNNFGKRKEYFKNFKSVDEFIAHGCSFWCYGVATEDSYVCGNTDNPIEWTTSFFDRFVKTLPDSMRISIYEIKLI